MIVHVPTWVTAHVWPGWERDTFLAWCEAQNLIDVEDPWGLFATWWRLDGAWR